MKKLIVLFLCVFSFACDSGGEVTLGGTADVNVQDNFTECQVRQNGTTLFVRQNGGLDQYSFAFDPSIVYEDAWVTLTIADALRITPLTVVEQGIIDGTTP